MEKEIKIRKKRFAAFWAVALLVCSLVVPTTVNAADYTLSDLSVGSVLQPGKTIANAGAIFKVSYSTGNSEEGAEITLASYDAIPAGQAFDGWEITNIEEEDHSGVIVKHVTLTAQFSTASYTVTFDTDGGTDIESITKAYNETVDAPSTPSKEGYDFAGWDVTFPYTVTGDVTITALWNIKQYTITFDTDGGSAMEPITQDFGTDVTAPADPTKTDYTFVGWEPELPATMPAENMTVTAKWKSKYLIEKGTHELTAGVRYQLGSGVTRVSGDTSVYASGSYFYVPADDTYTFQ